MKTKKLRAKVCVLTIDSLFYPLCRIAANSCSTHSDEEYDLPYGEEEDLDGEGKFLRPLEPNFVTETNPIGYLSTHLDDEEDELGGEEGEDDDDDA